MKKLFFVAALVSLIFSGCSKDEYSNEITEGFGAVQIDLTSSGEFTETKTGNVEVGNFYVRILKGETVVKSYNSYSQVPNAVEVAPGTYTIEAGTHEKDPAAFDQPIFYGSKDFTVAAGKVVPVNLTCKLTNMKVTIKYTETFGNEIADNFEIAVTNGTGNLVFTKTIIDNGSSGYFTVAPLVVKLTAQRKNIGDEVLHTIEIPDGKAQDHFILTFDAQETGDIEFGTEDGGSGIVIDWSVNNREHEVIIPGEDETEIPDENPEGGDPEGGEGSGDNEGGNDPVEEYLPTVSGDGIGTPKEISMSADNENVAVDINIAALNGKTIKDILVTISSDPVDFQNLVGMLFPSLGGTFSIVDFSDAQGAERKMVLGPMTESNPDGLGLIADPDTDPIAGKTSYTFQIGHFMGALASTGLSVGTLCNFKLKVIDSEDKETTATCVIKMVE